MSLRRKVRGSLWMAGILFAFQVSFAQVGTPVPVLCYHGFSDDTSAGMGKLTEQYTRFGEMLQFLREEGYTTVFPEDCESGGKKEEKTIIITFDDGRKEQLRAAEMMRKNGMRGIFFVIASRVSRESTDYLSPSDLALLTSWGHQIGVHGSTHKSMVESSEETEEVRKIALETIKEAVPSQASFTSFAFPFGHYDTSIVVLTSVRFRFLHTVNPGYWDRRSKLIPRMLVTVDKPAEFFTNYVKRSSQFSPSLVAITPDGGRASVVSFRVLKTVSISDLSVTAISADRNGYHYSSNPASNFISIDGDTLSFNLRKYIEHYHAPTRIVLSYAFFKADESAFVSSGQSHWIPNTE